MNRNEFLLDLANVLEKHSVAICAKKCNEECEVVFQHIETKPHVVTNLPTTRLHVSAYDLRGQAGMSCAEANNLYQLHKRLVRGIT